MTLHRALASGLALLVLSLHVGNAAAQTNTSAGWLFTFPSLDEAAAVVSGGGPLNVPSTPWFDSLPAQTKPVEGYEGSREAPIPHPEQAQAAAARLASAASKPNILIFLMDDIGWGDLGVYGGGAAVGSPTPNMDRAARNGLMLTSTYSQPTCSPTRGSLLTGRLPMRHGLLRPPMAGESGGLEGEVTLANLLSGAGYATAAVGKWHLGENNASFPTNVGFGNYLGFLSVSDVYTEWRDPRIHPDIVARPGRTRLASDLVGSRTLVRSNGTGSMENLAEIDIPLMERLDEVFLNHSLEFLANNTGSNSPFFLYHATTGCHFDNYPGRWAGASPAAYPYPDCLVHVDAVFGSLMAALERNGQANNTLVFVTSDNGPEMETWPDSGRTPFRGSKGSTWEGGVRVPGIAYWPTVISPGRVSDGLFDLMDLFATSATLAGAGAAIPKDRYIDSIDQTGFLLSDGGLSARRIVYYWMQDVFSGVRVAECASPFLLCRLRCAAADCLPPRLPREVHDCGNLLGVHAGQRDAGRAVGRHHEVPDGQTLQPLLGPEGGALRPHPQPALHQRVPGRHPGARRHLQEVPAQENRLPGAGGGGPLRRGRASAEIES